MKILIRRSTYLIVISANLFLMACKKFVDAGEPKKLVSNVSIFSSDATATSALLSIYAKMDNGFMYKIIYSTGMLADEIMTWSGESDKIDLSANNITPLNIYPYLAWAENYDFIYQANAIIEGLSKSESLSASVRRQLEGEARFIRAFCYFHLVNYFGDVPIVTTTNYVINSSPARSQVDSVYNLIEQDLEAAQELLSNDYMDGHNMPTSERVRPNTAVANALLARVLLYREKWNLAESTASEIIENGVYTLSDLNSVFLANSTEAIWQHMSVVPTYNTVAGDYLILVSTPYDPSLKPSFVADFQPSDLRRKEWIGEYEEGSDKYFFPSKYKVIHGASTITEYTMVLRLAEQYLIRAEARARQDKLSAAEEDLNLIRSRAGLPILIGLSKAALLDSIQLERKFELFAEAGDRWFNLKRTHTADAVLSVLKGADWQATDQLYPIPTSELRLNPNLKQNPGY